MRVLYIGLYGEGQTCKMRGETIKKILNPSLFQVIDIQIPFQNANRILRSLAFRYKIGPFVKLINKYIVERLNDNYDLVWVDKAIFIDLDTTLLLKKRTKLLIHFTPDCAFFDNKSLPFYDSIRMYDKVVTTKSFEVELYQKYTDRNKIILTTQGFDSSIHFPLSKFEQKKGVVFIGLYEKNREIVLQNILENGIDLKLAGMNWESFVRKNKDYPNLYYLGKGIYSNEYSRIVSSSLFGLGLLSKRMPELHTTRTFEIPACGTALITEGNSEVLKYFTSSEAIFFDNLIQLVEKIKYYQANLNELENLTLAGYKRVNADNRDYGSIIKNILLNEIN